MADSETIREQTFEFAHMLADADFRRALRKAGGRKRRDVLVADENEPFDSVMRRAIKQTRPPLVIAVRRPATYTLVRLEPKPRWLSLLARWRNPTPPLLQIDANTTIGEVCQALQARDETVAAERWSWFRLRSIADDHAMAH